MPLYDYRCPEGHVTTELRGFDQRDTPVVCKCGQPTERLFPRTHRLPDGMYSYAPNLGDPEKFERRHEAAKRRKEGDRSTLDAG